MRLSNRLLCVDFIFMHIEFVTMYSVQFTMGSEAKFGAGTKVEVGANNKRATTVRYAQNIPS